MRKSIPRPLSFDVEHAGTEAALAETGVDFGTLFDVGCVAEELPFRVVDESIAALQNAQGAKGGEAVSRSIGAAVQQDETGYGSSFEAGT